MLEYVIGMEVAQWKQRAGVSPGRAGVPTVRGVSSGVQGLAHSLMGLETDLIAPSHIPVTHATHAHRLSLDGCSEPKCQLIHLQ